MKKWLLLVLVVCVVAVVGISYLGAPQAGDLTQYGVKSWSHYASSQGFRVDYPTGWKVEPYDAQAGRGAQFSHSPKGDASIIAVRSHVPRETLRDLARQCGSELSAYDECQDAVMDSFYFGYTSGLAMDVVISGQPAKVALFEYADAKNRKVQGYRITTLAPDGKQFCTIVSLVEGKLTALDALKDKVVGSLKFGASQGQKR